MLIVLLGYPNLFEKQRYFIVVLLAQGGLVAAGLVRLKRRWGPVHWPATAAAVLVTAFSFYHYVQMPRPNPWKAMSAFLQQHRAANERVIGYADVSPNFLWHHNRYRDSLPAITSGMAQRIRNDATADPELLVHELTRSAGGVWLVFGIEHWEDFETKGPLYRELRDFVDPLIESFPGRQTHEFAGGVLLHLTPPASP